MEAFGEVAKAARKFGEILEKVFGPKLTRKQADADAYADEKKLQTIRDNPDMDIVIIDGQLNARRCTPEALAYRAQQRAHADALRQEKNLEKVLEITDCEISKLQDVSDAPLDDDWVTRFFSIVKDISNEEMQYIWGKILAGEIASPNSFSLRTLDTLRNISAEDARKFQNVVPLVLRLGPNYFLVSEGEVLPKYEIRYGDILALDECGLVNSGAMMSLSPRVSQNEKKLIYNDKYLIILRGHKVVHEKLNIGVYTLTKVGEELYKTLSHARENSDEYMKLIAKHIYEENKGKVKMSVHEIISFEKDGASINYNTTPIVSYGERD